ncbi:RNase H family protein [Paenilisteria rocourtiae]|uniref:RNase HI n=1 Tax=Listeria rocourtiae TaxID=647910 RepID=A0A4V3DQ90_9LIST|nr:RNase H family protein [Listeria rocourtiae]EUJ49389.1 ribonuclease HI [Listeria rocourtiae FSL F6-920]MBC1435840.1 reverse transcriptase-like protein [Listeria rocourtiae]MBC1603449.1 reverse transcriptase-like protein [Listeria rocourtiae]TDR55266.1 RNase HI [Listeria rocourtiae]
MEIYADGASAGNPGPSGIGIVITADGIHEQISIPLGILSNHEAEFIAIKTALAKAIPYNPSFIRLYSDSKVAVDAIEKRYVKNPLFQSHLDAILHFIEPLDLFFIQWIPSASNKKADDLARQAIHKHKKN